MHRNGSKGSQVILVGNKVDLGNKRVISEEQAEKYAKKHRLNYVEVSACNAMNINLIFETVVKNILIVKEESEGQAQQAPGRTGNNVHIAKNNN
jgi:Ras-related protein Rab-13